MRKFIILLTSIFLIAGAYYLETSIVSFVQSLFPHESSYSITEYEPCAPQPSYQHMPALFPPSSSPAAASDASCFSCTGSRECQDCEGLGVVFSNYFGFQSGYGMQTLMDRVCYECKGSGICRFCANDR